MKVLLSGILILGLTGCAVQREYSYTESYDSLGYYRDSGVRVHIGNSYTPPHPPRFHNNHRYGPAIKPPPPNKHPSPSKHFVDNHGYKPPPAQIDERRDDKRPSNVWNDKNDKKPSNPPPKHGPMR